MKTVILGASANPERYSYKAAHLLVKHGHDIVPIGISNETLAGHTIITQPEVWNDIHTITLYLNPEKQKGWYDYILQTKPTRIIFNPGAENEELSNLAENAGIAVENACTLVLLNTGQY